MLLLSRPPYLRWAAAFLVVACALAWDLHGRRTVPYPVAGSDIAAGASISASVVEWRRIPAGLFAEVDLSNRVALTSIRQGDPLTSSVVASQSPIPPGWWSVAVPIPLGLEVGARVRLVIADSASVEGIVAAPASEDRFGVQSLGSVAVPPGHADAVASAASSNAVTVLVAP